MKTLDDIFWWVTVALGSLLVLAILIPLLLFYVLGMPIEGEHLGSHFVVVRNETESEVTIEWQSPQGEWLTLLVTVKPGDEAGSIGTSTWLGEHSLVGRDGCSIVPLRAVSEAGDEIERRSPPLCDGDLWIIDGIARAD